MFKNKVAETIEKKHSFGISFKDGTTPLHWAVRKNKIDVMMELLKKGAKINAQDKVPKFLG